jgi:hypothetical protein
VASIFPPMTVMLPSVSPASVNFLSFGRQCTPGGMIVFSNFTSPGWL